MIVDLEVSGHGHAVIEGFSAEQAFKVCGL
jgi:hypothetical protein